MTYNKIVNTTHTKPLRSVTELTIYRTRAAALLTVEEQAAVVNLIARDPECGALVPGGSGIRKMRFAIGDRGKSGGVRVIYYYHDPDNPIFLITVYAKASQANLTKGEKNALAKLVKQLIDTY